MSNLDTTTPISGFEVVNEDGTVTSVPVASGGEKWYRHDILIKNSNIPKISLAITNNSNEIFTVKTLNNFMIGSTFETGLAVNGIEQTPTKIDTILTIFNDGEIDNSTSIKYFVQRLYWSKNDDGTLTFGTTNTTSSLTSIKIVDTVREL